MNFLFISRMFCVTCRLDSDNSCIFDNNNDYDGGGDDDDDDDDDDNNK